MAATNFKLDLGVDQDRWQRLLDEIDEGNVIPIIGSDMLVEPKLVRLSDHLEHVENLHQQLISFIAAQTNVTNCPRTFSQLVYNENYKQTVPDSGKIYNLIYQLLSNADQIDDIDTKPSKMLMDLLGTKKFPFVITTSFTPIVENAMREIWGDVKVLNFSNDPQGSSWERGGDIRTVSDMKQPTVFYMFGRYCNNSRDARFVVTDSDMMKFCSSWIKGDGIPKNLTEALKKKYLLILGNNYSDWLFRFIWFALRSTTSEMKSDVVVNDGAEESFKQFLERLETFFQESPAEVVKRIKEAMEERRLKEPADTVPATDVFISYSRTDVKLAERLYNRLTEQKLRVWFDRESIRKAENWEEAIVSGLRNTRMFVPILSKNVENESMVPHEYRIEWIKAAEMSQRIGGRTFIVPFVEDGFDFYNPLTKLPKEFTDKNATWYNEEQNLDEIVDVLCTELNRLKELETKLN